MRWNPEVTVAAIVERDNRFLIVEERSAGRLVLNQPAGHLEDRENLIDAAIRETREETAWRFRPEALVGTYLWRSPIDGRSFLRFAFCGPVDDHNPQQALDQGVVRALWMSHQQLLAQASRLRSPLVLSCLQDFLLGKRQPLDSVASVGLETALQMDSVVSL
ncbi:MAG: NUDIX hydrolase [Pseudomonadota bacterium]